MVDDSVAISFGAWVRSLRKQLDLTQAELGRRTGCSAAAIRKIEADERRPSRQLAELLVVALQIPNAQRERFIHLARGLITPKGVSGQNTALHNLPVLLTPMIGRSEELAFLCRWLRDPAIHLITLVGPPGIGKTRLSIQTAYTVLNDFANGVRFVDLAEISRADQFYLAIQRAFSEFSQYPDPAGEQLLNFLQEKSLLLILDNLEQIAEAASLEVDRMLQTCPKIKIFATSRVPLHLYGEYTYRLPPLTTPPPEAVAAPETLMNYEAVQLFTARVQQHDISFKVSAENAHTIIQLCTLLDGIPLAIELAAASLRRMTLEELWTMSLRRNWIRQTRTNALNIPSRQRTLEKVIEWSYNLLSSQLQEFFSTIGIFFGWFSEEAAAALYRTTPENARQHLQTLTDHSLLIRQSLQGHTVWRMQDPIREYALRQLSQEQRRSIHRLHAEYFIQQLQTFRKKATTTAERLNFYNLHHLNLMAALHWEMREESTGAAFQIQEALDEMWSAQGYQRQELVVTDYWMSLPEDLPPAAIIQHLYTAADLARQKSELRPALEYAQKALEISRMHKSDGLTAVLLNLLGRIYIEQENFPEARAVLQECYTLSQIFPQQLNPGLPLTQSGEIALFEGRLNESRTLLAQALEQLPPSMILFQAMAATDLAEIALQQGDLTQTRYWLEQACLTASQHVRCIVVFLCTLAGYLTLSDQNEAGLRRAASLFGAIEALRQRSGVILIGFYQRLNQERANLLRQKLPPEVWESAYSAGYNWSIHEIVHQVIMTLS